MSVLDSSPSDWSQCPAVESVPGKVSGAWVFRDTRLPVATVIENLEDLSVEEVMEQFNVTLEQMAAVLESVAQSLKSPEPEAVAPVGVHFFTTGPASPKPSGALSKPRTEPSNPFLVGEAQRLRSVCQAAPISTAHIGVRNIVATLRDPKPYSLDVQFRIAQRNVDQNRLVPGTLRLAHNAQCPMTSQSCFQHKAVSIREQRPASSIASRAAGIAERAG